MVASVVPVDVSTDVPKEQKHAWRTSGAGNSEDLEANMPGPRDTPRFKTIRRILAQLDLRFQGDRLMEDAFADSLEPEVLKCGFWVCLVGAVLILCGLVPVAVRESRSTQAPLQFQNWDVRLSLLLVWALTLMVTVSYCVTSCLRMWKNWFRAWNWEVYFLIVAMCYIMSLSLANLWHMPCLVGSHPSKVWQHDVHGSEVFALLAIDGFLTAVAMYVPVRTCMLWILPVVGVGSYLFTFVAVDCTLPSDLHLTIGVLVLLAFFSQHGAFRDETRRRQHWQALVLVKKTEEVVLNQTNNIQDTSALLQGLQDVVSSLCDFLMFLTNDLIIQSSEKAHQAFFEQDIEGLRFTDFLQEGDAARFESFIKLVSESNSRTPACLPVTVKRASATSVCHLLVVDTGTREPRYLMAVRVEREEIHTPVLGQDLFPTAYDLPKDSLSHQQNLAEDTNLAETLGLAPAVSMGGLRVGGWTSSVANDSDISFTTFPKGPLPPSPNFTPVPSMAYALEKLLPRWNIPRDSDSCCHFHTVVLAVPSVLQHLQGKKCNPLWSNVGPAQCEVCWSMCREDWKRCAICSHENPELS